MSDEPSWTTESRNDGEDKRKVIKGWWAGCVVEVSGDLRRRRTVGVAEDAEDLNRPARVGANDVPAWNWDLSLSQDGKDNLTMRKKGREGGKVREDEKKRGKSGRSEEESSRAASIVRSRILCHRQSLHPVRVLGLSSTITSTIRSLPFYYTSADTHDTDLRDSDSPSSPHALHVTVLYPLGRQNMHQKPALYLNLGIFLSPSLDS